VVLNKTSIEETNMKMTEKGGRDGFDLFGGAVELDDSRRGSIIRCPGKHKIGWHLRDIYAGI
jgi:hypothetical protein